MYREDISFPVREVPTDNMAHPLHMVFRICRLLDNIESERSNPLRRREEYREQLREQMRRYEEEKRQWEEAKRRFEAEREARRARGEADVEEFPHPEPRRPGAMIIDSTGAMADECISLAYTVGRLVEHLRWVVERGEQILEGQR